MPSDERHRLESLADLADQNSKSSSGAGKERRPELHGGGYGDAGVGPGRRRKTEGDFWSAFRL